MGIFLPDRLNNKTFSDDPFQTIEQDDVGELSQLGIEHSRKTRPDLKVGICGEHGGEQAEPAPTSSSSAVAWA